MLRRCALGLGLLLIASSSHAQQIDGGEPTMSPRPSDAPSASPSPSEAPSPLPPPATASASPRPSPAPPSTASPTPGATPTAVPATSTTLAPAPTHRGASREYARRSTSVLLSYEVAAPPTVTGRAVLDATMRWTVHGFVIQPRFGVGVGFSAASIGANVAVRPGIGLGYAFPVARQVLIVPTIGYDLFVIANTSPVNAVLIHRVSLDLAVTIVLWRHAVLEPFLLAGVSVLDSQVDFAFAFGPRLGITF